MKLLENPFDDRFTSLCRRLKSWGGVVEYVKMRKEPQKISTNDPYVLHLEMANVTAHTVTERTLQFRRHVYYQDQARWKQAFPGITDANIYRTDHRKGLEIRKEDARGSQIPLSQFLAPPVICVKHNELQHAPHWLNLQQIQEDMETYHVEEMDVATGSYLHAFYNPPYGLHVKDSNEGDLPRPTQEEKEELFQAINLQLFGKMEDLIVYQWTTDWIDFFRFDQDADWWGSYLWTVSNKQQSLLVGIAASATD